jgi:hypothetical protein
VQRRVESGAEVVAASEAKLIEHAHSLVMHGLDAGHDRAGIGIGVAERSLKVVHHRKPQPCDPRPRIGLCPADLACAFLPRVVQVC